LWHIIKSATLWRIALIANADWHNLSSESEPSL
jgi:hypothetical protein